MNEPLSREDKPWLLDLFCGAGGAARGYQQAGFYVVGVDIAPQPRYAGDEFIQADAMTFPLEGFDAIHASPPCQAFSSKTRHPGQHPDLLTPTIKRLYGARTPFIVENVVGAPMADPVTLCGSLFGLRVRRHRWFESSIDILQRPCEHFWQDADPIFDLYDHGRWFRSGIVHVFGTGGGKAREHWAEAMGIDWMTPGELTQAIPPAYTFYVGTRLLEAIHG